MGCNEAWNQALYRLQELTLQKLHLSILQELARLETQQELEEAILEILNLLDGVMDGRLPPQEEDNLDTPTAKEFPHINPFEGGILWRG